MMCRILAYVVVFLTASNLLGQEYEIHLTRADQVGDKSEMEAVSSQSSLMSISRQGQLQKNNSTQTVTLEGIKTVLEVDGSRIATKLSVVVSRFVVARDGKENEQEALAKGAQIVAQWEQGETVFFVNGKKASEDIAVILLDFFPSHTTKATDDEIFGTNERKKVGDTWPVNSIKAAADLSSKVSEISPENIKGITKLEKIVENEGIQCLRINGNIEFNGAELPVPAGMALEKAAVSATFTGDFPIDLTIGVLSEEALFTMRAEAKGKASPDAPESTMSLSVTASKKEKYRPLKPALKL